MPRSTFVFPIPDTGIAKCGYATAMPMFGNLGRTLALLREMRGYSQLALSREARIGKSQLSKYENGRELPKLETLERILRVLDVQPIGFFQTVAALDSLVSRLDAPCFEPDLELLFRMYRLQTEVQARLESFTTAARPRPRG